MLFVNNIINYGRRRMNGGTGVAENDPEVPHLQQMAARLSVVYNPPPQEAGSRPESVAPNKKLPKSEKNVGFLQKMHENHVFRHIVWLLVLFAYSLLGGFVFSAIEGRSFSNNRASIID
uniref:Uncharacterized protein n=1 Tax=Plectus sambesii TaxID=2011161 RepID=A0A914W0E8_9BILA